MSILFYAFARIIVSLVFVLKGCLKVSAIVMKMFSKRLFHVHRKPDNNFFTPKPMKPYQVIADKAKRHIKVFLENSSIHGFNHLVAPKRHPIEIICWLTIIFLCGFGSLYLSQMTWNRYQSSPTVISMDRDMFAFNTTFPCITVCPTDYIDKKKLEDYARNSNEVNKTKLETFIITLSSVNYKNFENIPNYTAISPDKYMELLFNLSVPFKPVLTIGAPNVSMSVMPTITEMGLCYSLNSRTAEYNSPQYRAANRWDIINNELPFFIHPLDGEVFAQAINISTPYDVYIHGPHEVPDISTKFQHSEIGFYMHLYVTALAVYTSPEAAKLSVNQRRCRFPYENNLKHNSIYTYTMCRMECRIRLCLKHCQCIPHFYRRIGNEKVCDADGLHCLSKFKDELYKLLDKTGKRINCGCLPLCDDVNYVIQTNTAWEWFLGTNLQWGIVTYPRMRYRRDIIFDFSDLLVAVGGMVGLFLGCSVLSFMEIVYFATLRLFCYSRNSK